MSTDDINLAVARACGLPIHNKLPPGWEHAEPFVLHSEMLGELRLSSGSGSCFYNPRNDDALAIAVLERFISDGSLKAYIIVTAIGHQVEIVTYPEDDHVSWAENAKLSHAITDAILAAQEKRNA